MTTFCGVVRVTPTMTLVVQTLNFVVMTATTQTRSKVSGSERFFQSLFFTRVRPVTSFLFCTRSVTSFFSAPSVRPVSSFKMRGRN